MSESSVRPECTRARLERLGPWPGPVPYEEGDRYFRGRTEKLNRILRKLGVEQLVIVTGRSGTGKTSLLRAAVIPTLRGERAAAVKTDRAAVPAVLLVRDWLTATRKTEDCHKVLNDAITESIKKLGSEVAATYEADSTIQNTIKGDHEAMLAIAAEAEQWTTYQYTSALAEAAGSLLLCVDQFEEVLQGSSEQRDGLLDNMAELAKCNYRIKILLSFRQEFLSLFRRLDHHFGNLAMATVYLEEMPEGEVRTAVLDAADAAGVSIGEDVLSKLLNWMREMQQEEHTGRLAGVKPDETVVPEKATAPAVDLQRLQAVLRELYICAAARPQTESLVTISEHTLEQLLQEERSEHPELQLTGPKLMQSALRMFIDRRVLPLPSAKPGRASGQPSSISAAKGLPSHLSESEEEQLMHPLLQRRIAARMAPFFSSLGLKVQQHEAHLIAAALREEWRVLEQSPEDVKRLIEEVGLRAASANLHLLGLGRQKIDLQAPILSGSVMKRRQRSYSAAVKYLLDACVATLDQFADSSVNVLRPKMTRKGTVYELVHDGFGPAWYDWSEYVRSNPLDALGAITAQRGESFYWSKLGGTIRQVCWRGCWIGPDTDDRLLEFDNVEWIKCDLRGTLFDRCVFNGGAFQRCDLDGVIFRNCEFTAAPATGRRFAFYHIDTYGLNFFGGSLTSVDFEKCTLRQMLWSFGPQQEMQKLRVSDVNIEHCELLYQWSVTPTAVIFEGPLRLKKCILHLCDLYGLQNDEVQSGVVVIENSEFAHCHMGPALAHLIDESKGNERRP